MVSSLTKRAKLAGSLTKKDRKRRVNNAMVFVSEVENGGFIYPFPKSKKCSKSGGDISIKYSTLQTISASLMSFFVTKSPALM